jgi:hypothetical protein
MYRVLFRLFYCRRTVHPAVSEVFFDGALIGQAARNPYGLGWLASCDGKRLYWSKLDAGLALYQNTRDE